MNFNELLYISSDWYRCKWGYNCVVLIRWGRSMSTGGKMKPRLSPPGVDRLSNQGGQSAGSLEFSLRFFLRVPVSKWPIDFYYFYNLYPQLTMGSPSHQINFFSGFTWTESFISGSTLVRMLELIFFPLINLFSPQFYWDIIDIHHSIILRYTA